MREALLMESLESLDAPCHGGRNRCIKYVNKEDILISRGANPRTGIVSPFIQEELHQAGFENDYIHVRGVHQATNKKTGAHERWRHDALVWTLIECQSDRSSRKSFRSDTMDEDGIKAVPGQLTVPTERRNPERSFNTGAVEFDRDKTATVTALVQSDSNHAPQTSSLCLGPKVKTLPKEIYRVPRKQVGSVTIAPMPVSVAGVNGNPTSSTISPRPPLKKRRARPLLPAHLAAEDVVLGYHAYPSVSSRSQQTNSDQSIPRPTVKHSDESNMCLPRDENNAQFCLNGERTAVSPPITSITSRLGIKYRRPKHFLPAWLRGQYASNLESNQVNSDRDLHSSRGATGPPILEGPLRETGLPRLGGVPFSEVRLETEGVKFTSTPSFDKQNSKTLPAVHIAPSPSTSTCAALEYHNGLHEFEETGSRSRQPSTRFEIGKVPPILAANGIPKAEQKTSIRPPRLTAWGPPNSCDDLMGPTSAETPMREHHHQPMARRRSITGALESWLSLCRHAQELGFLIDVKGVRDQGLRTVRHVAMTLDNIPWALRMLGSQDIEVRDYLLALRCLIAKIVYLIVSFSVLASLMKIGRLILDIGVWFWLPVKLLIGVFRWILLH